MDLTNKIVNINALSMTTYPPSTLVKVNLTQEVAPGIFKQVDSYDIQIDAGYQSTDDPALLAAINEKLAALP